LQGISGGYQFSILNFQLSILTQGVAIGLDLFKPLQGISGGYQFSIPNSQFSIQKSLLPYHIVFFVFLDVPKQQPSLHIRICHTIKGSRHRY